MIRVAAVGDLHIGPDAFLDWRHALEQVSAQAELLLLAGDLTQTGAPAEAKALLSALGPVTIPIAAVLGNHDYHSGCAADIAATLRDRGVHVLEGDAMQLSIDGARVGIAGSKGFGGGFANACGSEFGEPEMKAFVGHTRVLSERLGQALASLEADLRIVLLHYAPIPATLQGERSEIYPFLGSHLLGEAIDSAGADLVLHGHAHAGSEKGVTPAGVRVRNVAQPVIRSAYRVYCLEAGASVDCGQAAGAARL
jgi:Icc-related predicted phosphoesterase